jgi:hypothetical protein
MAIIAGPYEFLVDFPSGEGGGSAPYADEARRALRAHSLLRVDAGWISTRAANWLRTQAGKIPSGYHSVATDPVSRVMETPLGKIGIVFFPEGPTPGKAPTPEQERAALAAGRALREKTALLIGVSPWGLVGEKKFLPGARGIFDCILGGGEGVAFAQSLPDDTPDILWMRPDGKGRAVTILEILRIPRRSSSREKGPQTDRRAPLWLENVTFRASLEFLDANVPSDPDMRRVIGASPR